MSVNQYIFVGCIPLSSHLVMVQGQNGRSHCFRTNNKGLKSITTSLFGGVGSNPTCVTLFGSEWTWNNCKYLFHFSSKYHTPEQNDKTDFHDLQTCFIHRLLQSGDQSEIPTISNYKQFLIYRETSFLVLSHIFFSFL